VLAALFVGGTAGAATASSAGGAGAANDQNSNTIQGTLRNTAKDNEPVQGVTITVTKAGKTYTDTTDANGQFSIEVPGDGGPVTVKLEESTLPDGVKLRAGSTAERRVVLTPGQSLPVAFPIGADSRKVSTKWDQIPQLLYNGLLFGLIIAMASLGLSMVFGTTGLTNFAHGELVTFGAIVAYWFNVVLGWPLALAGLITLALAAAFGYAQEKGLWGPLRHRGTGLIAMMIVSIGFQFFLRNLFQYFTGGRTMNYGEYVTPSGDTFLGVTYTYRDLILIGVSIAVLVAATLGLSRTRLGRATRAVADNPALAASTGINVDRVIMLVWVMGTALASLSGIFLGFQLGVTFQIGQLVLLLLFAAVVVGGLGSVWGALLGSLIVGVLIEVSTLVVPSDLKNAGALLLLIVILLVRPQGLLGRRERIG
jgi:branched-chain amino acid transport system permease protein